MPSNQVGFDSWDAYFKFANRVRTKRRFVWDDFTEQFLSTVLATLADRDVTLSSGQIFWRAQRGVEYVPNIQDGVEVGEDIVGHAIKRMKPLSGRAFEGRANPAGRPALYLGSKKVVAISEVRPWVGDKISLAQFRLSRDLRLVDLSKGHDQNVLSHVKFNVLLGEASSTTEDNNAAVWIEIDQAFSRPVTKSDDRADYVPTQILSELFLGAGYDGLIYRSSFGEKGYNIVLFDPDDANLINCQPYEVGEINVEFKEIGNMYYVSDSGASA